MGFGAGTLLPQQGAAAGTTVKGLLGIWLLLEGTASSAVCTMKLGTGLAARGGSGGFLWQCRCWA